ncbi:MAG: glutamine--tRNA ligase/YqeY domain fusion protein [Synergistales bacterium]|jgi:glutaminyl-tRNA synthetase|nr:glutamine--tRNA ligase/YqeY domain fusion protein [Bacteroidales bacterium]MDY6403177.1 glutamine--tRNA ligase/YqeY domain fusion protein [Bacteroidales bacterium]MDY6435364.1 glutamine--tRNA ligase/YqeY domain fusion protein [Synergistales bacterium]
MLEEKVQKNFLEEIIENDLKEGKVKAIQTRFPPEPNGYLHIGHAKSICINFGLAQKYGGKTNLRFDDTNPVKEDTEYVDSIKEDIKWLGFNWAIERYASDYFEQLYQWAIELIKKGKAYVDDQTNEEIRLNRGTVTSPGKDSPYRNRSIEENLQLFEQMREGKFADGEKTLRAKIDMAHPNMNMRDPIMYRIIHTSHHRTGDKWCIYPMYDYAHGESDSIENITHSICTLEFDIHRPLYDWFIEQLGIFPSHQYEFARLNITNTVMSKRKLLQLVKEGYVKGWDDPRMPTICGLRRRGYTPESIRNFCEDIGVAKRDNLIDYSRLEGSLRDDLNKRADRVMGVLHPIKLIIDNCPDDFVDELEAVNNPEDESKGTRKITFSNTLYIEADDFMEDAPKKYFRLTPGQEVRLRYAYIVKCTHCDKDENGNVIAVHCTYDPASRGGNATDGRKIKGTIHWVNAKDCANAEVRLFDRLFDAEIPDKVEEGKTFLDNLNPNSLTVLKNCKMEKAVIGAEHLKKYQFERLGYFSVDYDSTKDYLVFNRTCTLKDSWAKQK